MGRYFRAATLALALLLALAACDAAPRAAPAPTAPPRTATSQATSASPTVGATVPAVTVSRTASTIPHATRPAAIAASPTVTPDPVAAQEAFASLLRKRGVTVERLSETARPYFRVFGARLRLGGGPLPQPAEISAFSYPDTALAAADAARVQPDTSARWTEPDGTGKGVTSTWVATPHFFHRDGTIVIYVGDDAALLALLTDLLGPQYAGR